jgi:hypothetical protein
MCLALLLVLFAFFDAKKRSARKTPPKAVPQISSAQVEEIDDIFDKGLFETFQGSTEQVVIVKEGELDDDDVKDLLARSKGNAPDKQLADIEQNIEAIHDILSFTRKAISTYDESRNVLSELSLDLQDWYRHADTKMQNLGTPPEPNYYTSAQFLLESPDGYLEEFGSSRVEIRGLAVKACMYFTRGYLRGVPESFSKSIQVLVQDCENKEALGGTKLSKGSDQ